MRIEAIEPQQTTSDLVVERTAGVIRSRHLAAGGRSPGEHELTGILKKFVRDFETFSP
jgi:DNA-binding FadR family transcriptional regulator